MRRSALIVGVMACVLALGVAPSAQAAPPVERFHDTGTDTDDNFCGTGEVVTITFDVRGTVHADDGLDVFVTAHGTQTFTAESTGQSVILHFAQRFVSHGVENSDGTVSFTDTVTGLPEQFRTPNGGVITLDAGLITFEGTLDASGEFVEQHIVVVHGPHPAAESDFELFCQLIPEALGIG
jgi:hypothetical protein